jgi:hypothetical protein
MKSKHNGMYNIKESFVCYAINLSISLFDDQKRSLVLQQADSVNMKV